MSDTTNAVPATPVAAVTTTTAKPAATTATASAAKAAPSTPSKFDHYVAVLMLVLSIVGGFWLHAKIEASREVTKIVQQAAPVLKQDAQAVATAQKDQDSVAAVLATQLAAISKQQVQPVQPVDYARISELIAEQIKVQPQQVQTQTASNGVAETTVPTQQLRDEVLSCQATQDQVTACQKTQTDLKAQVTALTNSNQTLQAEEKKEEQVAKGGSLKHRLLGALKHGACGAVGAGAGLYGGGIEGGVAGYGACELLLHKW